MNRRNSHWTNTSFTEEYGFLPLVILDPFGQWWFNDPCWENQTQSRVIIMRSLLWIVHALLGVTPCRNLRCFVDRNIEGFSSRNWRGPWKWRPFFRIWKRPRQFLELMGTVMNPMDSHAKGGVNQMFFWSSDWRDNRIELMSDGEEGLLSLFRTASRLNNSPITGLHYINVHESCHTKHSRITDSSVKPSALKGPLYKFMDIKEKQGEIPLLQGSVWFFLCRDNGSSAQRAFEPFRREQHNSLHNFPPVTSDRGVRCCDIDQLKTLKETFPNKKR